MIAFDTASSHEGKIQHRLGLRGCRCGYWPHAEVTLYEPAFIKRFVRELFIGAPLVLSLLGSACSSVK